MTATLQPHQQRVVEEQAQLSERLAKLTTFVTGDAFNLIPGAERKRLIRQLFLMEQLDHVLLERIAAWGS